MKTADLFDNPPFLENKLGSDTFKDIPNVPGIYRLYCDEGTLLYVGKAKNLRRRLFTYKRARAGKTTRKEASLISKISHFEFDVLSSEEEAILKENYWIREYRPEFNRANKHTETYYYITVLEYSGGFFFGLSMNPSGNLLQEEEKQMLNFSKLSHQTLHNRKVYGCFKGHRIVRTSLGSLLQLMWLTENKHHNPHFLPVQLSRNLTPMRFKMPFSAVTPDRQELGEMIDAWFLGESPALINYLSVRLQELSSSSFSKKFFEDSLEMILNYFQRNLKRYRLMRQTVSHRDTHLIAQNELDDLFVRINR